MIHADIHIVLIGMPGSGKSTLAPLLAESLGRDCYDSDDWIMDMTGLTPKVMIETQGEPLFRAAEYQALKSLFQKSPAVIATGGGCVTYVPSQTILNKHHVIYLKANVKTLFERLSHSHDRAFFDKTNLDAMPDFLANTLRERSMLYERLAHETWIVDHLTSHELCAQWEGLHVIA